jgi:hypothetical protein
MSETPSTIQRQLAQAQIDSFMAAPSGPKAAELLGRATSRVIYDEIRFLRSGQPAFAVTITRTAHANELVAGEVSDTHVALAYSDGFGRTIQNKVQAEPGKVPLRSEDGQLIIGANGQPLISQDDVSPRWVVNGWTIFNNKGQPVRQFEPFFSATQDFEFDVRFGVSPSLFYDPLGRVVGTLHPHHTWEKVVFDPWQQTSYDVNDTVLIDPASDAELGGYFRRLGDGEYLPTWHALRTDPVHSADALARWPDEHQRHAEATAAAKAAAHADTPAVVLFDSLGHPFLSITDNGPDGKCETRTELDVEGNPMSVVDDRENVVMSYQVLTNDGLLVPGYDMPAASSMRAAWTWANAAC